MSALRLCAHFLATWLLSGVLLGVVLGVWIGIVAGSIIATAYLDAIHWHLVFGARRANGRKPRDRSDPAAASQ